MNHRERALAAMSHQKPDRVPIRDAPWGTTLRRWKREGMPDMDAGDYFGYDKWFTMGVDTSPRFPTKTLEDTDEYRIFTTSRGGIRKDFKHKESTPEIIDWGMKSKDDWYKKIKPRLEPDFTRADWATFLAGYQTAQEEGYAVVHWCVIGYDMFQSYMKSDQLLMVLIEDPAWARDMFNTDAQLNIDMMKMILEQGIKIDICFSANDMGYRNAPLFSPQTFRDTQFEAHQMLYSFCHEHGIKTLLHSDGCVKSLIPALIESGLDCLQPLEVKAGMDLIELKEEYGDQLALMGGIDTRLMADPDPKKIEDEIARKFEVAMKDGAYLYFSDHSVPNNVSFAQYSRVMELVKKYGKY